MQEEYSKRMNEMIKYCQPDPLQLSRKKRIDILSSREKQTAFCSTVHEHIFATRYSNVLYFIVPTFLLLKTDQRNAKLHKEHLHAAKQRRPSTREQSTRM